MAWSQRSTMKSLTSSADNLVRGLSEMNNIPPWIMGPSIGMTSSVYDGPATIDADCENWHTLQHEREFYSDAVLDQWTDPFIPDPDTSGVLDTCLILDELESAPSDQRHPCLRVPANEHAEVPLEMLLNRTRDHVGQHGYITDGQERLHDSRNDLFIHQSQGRCTDPNESLPDSVMRYRHANELQTSQWRTDVTEHQPQPASSPYPDTHRFVPNLHSLAFGHQPYINSPFISSNLTASGEPVSHLGYQSLPCMLTSNELETYLTTSLSGHKDTVLPNHAAEDLISATPPSAHEHSSLQPSAALVDTGNYTVSTNAHSTQLVSDIVDKSSRTRRGVSRDAAQDKLLCQLKDEGIPYKEIKKRLNFKGAESTLRGRYRSLTKSKAQRPRKPQWSERDIEKLQEAVLHFMRIRHNPNMHLSNRSQQQSKQRDQLFGIPWKQVADHMVRQGCHRYGNFTVKNKYCEVMGLKVSKDTG